MILSRCTVSIVVSACILLGYGRGDCCSCALGVVLSLCFFRTFVGVQWGTILCALINGWLIGRISHILENHFVFEDAFPLRDKLQ